MTILSIILKYEHLMNDFKNMFIFQKIQEENNNSDICKGGPKSYPKNYFLPTINIIADFPIIIHFYNIFFPFYIFLFFCILNYYYSFRFKRNPKFQLYFISVSYKTYYIIFYITKQLAKQAVYILGSANKNMCL